MIIPDIATLEESKGKVEDQRNNILNILTNLQSVFTGLYFHHDNVPQPESEESIAERTKLRRQRSDEAVKKENMVDPKLFREYVDYLNPSDIYKNLNKTIGSKGSKAQVNAIKNRWANFMETFKSNFTIDAKKIKMRNNMFNIAELILEFNQLNQSGKGSKILTPNQMLSRLPISLAQLKAGNNSEKLKNEIRQLLHSLYRSKKLRKNIYKNLVDII